MPSIGRQAMTAIESLEATAALGWRAPEEARLGGWLLRAAEGFTGRANSALAIGDPGLAMADAVEGVCGWYRSRGLLPMIAVPFPTGRPHDSELDRFLARSGWRIRDGAAMVMTGSAAHMAARAAPARARVEVAHEPDDGWLTLYRYRGQELPLIARTLLMSAPWQAFASVRGDRRTIAVGRVAVAGGWAGLTALEVDPGYRRRGLGNAITGALAAQAVSHGVVGLYLQVETENAAARALYLRAGFSDHHGYHYRVAPAQD